MKQFLLKLAGFCSVQLVIFVTLALLYPGQTNNYLAAAIDKHKRARASTEPSMFFVGGSNVAFGVDSSAAQEAFGYEPVNLGLHVELGLDFMLNEVRALAKEGDVIILILEFEHFLEDMSDITLLQLLEWDPDSCQFLSLSQSKKLLDLALVYHRERIQRTMKGKRKKRGDPVHSRSAFDEFGDLVGHHGVPSDYEGQPPWLSYPPADLGHVDAVIDQLNKFQEECRARNIQAFFFFPAVAEDFYAAKKSQFDTVAERLDQRLQIPMLNRAQEMIYPHELIFSAAYHPTREGKEKRSEVLIRGLSEHLPLVERSQ